MADKTIQGGVVLAPALGAVSVTGVADYADTQGVGAHVTLGVNAMYTTRAGDTYKIVLGNYAAARHFMGDALRVESEDRTHGAARLRMQLGGNIVPSHGQVGSITGTRQHLSKTQGGVAVAMEKLRQVNARTAEMDSAIALMLRDTTTSGATAAEDLTDLAAAMSRPSGPLSDYADLGPSRPLDVVTQSIELTSPITDAEFRSLDPKVQAQLDRQQSTRIINAVVREFRARLREKPSWPVCKVALQYLDDLKRIGVTDVMLSNARALAQAVQSRSGDEYVNGPYSEFVSLSEGVTFNGYVPTWLSSDVQEIMDAMMSCERVVDQWRVQVAIRM